MRDILPDYSGVDPVFMLVGNRCHLSHPREVPTEEAKAFADEQSMMFVETSLKEDMTCTSFDAALLDFVRGQLRDGVDM